MESQVVGPPSYIFGVSEFTTQPWSFEQDVERYARLDVDTIEVCEAKLDERRVNEQLAHVERVGLTISSVQPAVRTLFPSLSQPEPKDVPARMARFRGTIERFGGRAGTNRRLSTRAFRAAAHWEDNMMAPRHVGLSWQRRSAAVNYHYVWPLAGAEPDRGAVVLSLGIISLACLVISCFPIGVILGLTFWVMGGAAGSTADPGSSTVPGQLYAFAGDKERALDWLEKAYDERDSQLVHLGVLPDWDILRGDPRFQALLHRMNYPL